MAAQPLVLKSYVEPLMTFDVNATGTANILEIGMTCDSVESILAITTDKVYRNHNQPKSFIESDPLEGHDPYSSSKVAAEAAIKSWQKIVSTSGGPSISSVRAGNVIGGGDFAENRLLPDLIRGFLSSDEVEIRNPQSTRPWQHVLDPLHGYILTLEANLNGGKIESLNFGPNGESLSVSKVIEISRGLWPSETRVNIVRADEGIEARTLALDSSKAREMLGWNPRWSQESAVESTLNWWINTRLMGISAQQACSSDIATLLENV